jgi:putative oxidoreductase
MNQIQRATTAASRLEGPAYALLRFLSGAMLACHGAQKVLGLFGGSIKPVGSQLWIGGAIELSCGLLIALGLLTRPAAFLAAGTMAVAYAQFHWKGALEGFRWLPIVNKGELAALYCFVFLLFVTRGGGPYSLDRRRGRG